MDKSLISSFIQDSAKFFSRLSDEIWDTPETAFVEVKSSKRLADAMEAFGFRVERGICGIDTAFVASYRSRGATDASPVIGFLGEFDALFGLSQKPGVAHQEAVVTGGNGHGCGHNMLGVGSLAAAAACRHYMEENGMPGTIRYFGCPGEEGGSGKAFMAKRGAFDDLDAALCWHPASINAVMHMSSLANYQVLYKFKGVSSHAAASPQLGRSALDAVELMNVGANYLREHVIPEARFHYAVTNTGGRSPNVVQADADVLYLIRAPHLDQVDEIYKRINKIAQGAALMTETEVEIRFIKACANIVPNEVIAECLYENYLAAHLPEYTDDERKFADAIKETTGDSPEALASFSNLSGRALDDVYESMKGKPLCERVIPFDPTLPEKSLSGSSDVGDVSWIVPTGQIAAACFAFGTPMHSWQAVSQGRTSLAHKGLLLCANVLAGTAIDMLSDGEIIKKAKAEFDKRMNGKRYVSPIPDGVEPTGLGDL